MTSPKVTIAPVTAVDQPYALKLGTKLLITLTVENIESQGQDYQLKGSQLPSDCYTLGALAMSADPGHPNQIEVLIHPTEVAAIGKHQLKLQLVSSEGGILWEDQVYLQFLVADDIEIMLTPDLTFIKDGVGVYQLLITNTSRFERVLTVQPKGLPVRNGLTFKAEPVQLDLGPDQTGKVDLMVQPRRWWLRPWLGKGRKFQFQVDLQDTNGIPLPQLLAQSGLVWQPYPRSHGLKLLGLLLLALGTSSALLWQFIWRQPTGPAIAALRSSQTVVPQTGQEDIQLSWTVKNSQQLSKVVILREHQGQSEVAKTFRFDQGIPQELQRSPLNQNSNFCEYEQPETGVLACTGITTGTTNPGKYQFQVQAFSSDNASEPMATQTTGLIAFKPNAVPLITRFYAPASRTNASTSGPVATATPGPIKLNWEIANPSQLTEVQIMTVDANNAEAALLQRYQLGNGKLPETLAKYCRFTPTLTCQNVPTAARKPGQYFFKITASYQQEQQPFTLSKTIGPMNIQAENLRIASFLINGQQAPAQYVLKPGQNYVNLTWKVEGGNNPSVAILPSPGKIPVAGSMKYQLNPQQPGAITLQATDLNGKQVLQTIAIGGTVAKAPPNRPKPPIAQAKPKPANAKPATPPLPFTAAYPPPFTPEPAMLRQNPLPPLPAQPLLPQATRPRRPVSKPVVSRPPQPRPPIAIKSSPQPKYSPAALKEAQLVTRGLVVARQNRKIVLNGSTWNKTQDAIKLLRRGYSREAAAKRAGVPLWKLNVLVSLGQRTR
ncbi:hypothetical protein [Acaryochloris sp. CCMEE 5410]|uniref:hypothetical protein n=1 Tax=Acaryochloris sp. CCMEE 5410 TaxID=310037 RepID=UPI0002484146|nr:hypothetical protein [Acaryochloris sp. CCMEE 5410]KAI9133899.1 hypothetical protein ON05_011735 [Acaryochloris sp. CCMEE 5410]